MAVKTITIDLEAYELLAGEKRRDESFSKVIKRHFGHNHSAEALLKDLQRVRISDATLDRVEALVGARRSSMAESPILDTSSD